VSVFLFDIMNNQLIRVLLCMHILMVRARVDIVVILRDTWRFQLWAKWNLSSPSIIGRWHVAFPRLYYYLL